MLTKGKIKALSGYSLRDLTLVLGIHFQNYLRKCGRDKFMDEKKKQAAQLKGIKAANRVIDGLAKVSRYSSYHAYKRSLRWANAFLLFAFVMACFTLIPVKINRTGITSSIVLLMLVAYFFIYYWIMAKAQVMKKDSQKVMLQVAFNGIISQGWNIYDGIFDEDGQESLEISFTEERPFITNLIYLFLHKKKTLPLSDSDIENLKYYIVGLNNISSPLRKYVAYGTMDNGLAKQLEQNGIQLTALSWHYKTKPGRWDFALATGKFSKALFLYPKFIAYEMSVDPKVFNYESSKKIDQKHQKHLSKKVRHLQEKLAVEQKKH